METKEDEKYEKHFYLCNEKGKPIHTSRQNLFAAIREFFLYMSNDDLYQLNEDVNTLLHTREKKEARAKLEAEKHSWPYPDTKKQKGRYDEK